MRTTWGLLDEYPPYLIRCFAKKKLAGKRIRAIADEEIAIISQIPLARVRAIYDSRTWDNVTVKELRAFCAACDFDPEDSSDRNRLTAYRNQRGGPKFTYLKESSHWKTIFKPLILKYFHEEPVQERPRNNRAAPAHVA